MKTILNPTGGRPIKNEDVELFAQFITMLEGLFGSLTGAGDFIVSGCEITGAGPYDISSGFIFYDSQICTFEGASGVSLPLTMEISTVQSSPRTFFDGVSKNSIETAYIVADVGGGFSFSATTPRLEERLLRKAVQSEGRSGTDDDYFMTSLRVLDALQNGSAFEATTLVKGVIQLNSITAQTNFIGPSSGAQQIALQSGFSLPGSGADDIEPNFVSVNERGDVFLSLNISRAADTNSFVCTLPAAFIPASNKSFETYIFGGGDALGTITVQSNGAVVVSTGDTYLNIIAKCSYKLADY